VTRQKKNKQMNLLLSIVLFDLLREVFRKS